MFIKINLEMESEVGPFLAVYSKHVVNKGSFNFNPLLWVLVFCLTVSQLQVQTSHRLTGLPSNVAADFSTPSTVGMKTIASDAKSYPTWVARLLVLQGPFCNLYFTMKQLTRTLRQFHHNSTGLAQFNIFYDNPLEVSGPHCRAAAGYIVADGYSEGRLALPYKPSLISLRSSADFQSS